MMRDKIQLWLMALTALLFFLAGYIVYIHQKQVRVAYVKTGFILEKYQGMADARRLMENKVKQWETTMDTMEVNYQKSLNDFNDESSRMPEKEKTELKNRLDRQSESLEKYMAAVQNKAVEENQKVMNGVVNQINDHIKKYSETKGYDLVVGVNGDGTILYGNDAIDITEEVLKDMNEKYKGK